MPRLPGIGQTQTAALAADAYRVRASERQKKKDRLAQMLAQGVDMFGRMMEEQGRGERARIEAGTAQQLATMQGSQDLANIAAAAAERRRLAAEQHPRALEVIEREGDQRVRGLEVGGEQARKNVEFQHPFILSQMDRQGKIDLGLMDRRGEIGSGHITQQGDVDMKREAARLGLMNDYERQARGELFDQELTKLEMSRLLNSMQNTRAASAAEAAEVEARPLRRQALEREDMIREDTQEHQMDLQRGGIEGQKEILNLQKELTPSEAEEARKQQGFKQVSALLENLQGRGYPPEFVSNLSNKLYQAVEEGRPITTQALADQTQLQALIQRAMAPESGVRGLENFVGDSELGMVGTQGRNLQEALADYLEQADRWDVARLAAIAYRNKLAGGFNAMELERIPYLDALIRVERVNPLQKMFGVEPTKPSIYKYPEAGFNEPPAVSEAVRSILNNARSRRMIDPEDLIRAGLLEK